MIVDATEFRPMRTSSQTPFLALKEAMRGKAVTDAALREMGEVAATEVDPMDDNRGSADYKREMVKVLVRRAAKEAFQRAS